MTLHLQKLCVGAESVEDLADWQAKKCQTLSRRKGYDVPYHTTRMMPRRAPEILDGGSLYWVIKGLLNVRQRIVDIRPFKDDDGVGRCDILLDPVLVRVAPRNCRAFQGWRYLRAADAPRDLDGLAEEGTGFEDFPADLKAKLAELALL